LRIEGDQALDIIGNKLLGSRKEAKAIVIDEIASRIDFFSYFRLSLFFAAILYCVLIASLTDVT
jgi:hypothetical protein